MHLPPHLIVCLMGNERHKPGFHSRGCFASGKLGAFCQHSLKAYFPNLIARASGLNQSRGWGRGVDLLAWLDIDKLPSLPTRPYYLLSNVLDRLLSGFAAYPEK